MQAMGELDSAVAEAAELGLAALAQVIARAPNGITVVDDRRGWVYANPAACEMLGRPLETLVGQESALAVPVGEQTLVSAAFTEQLSGGPVLSPHPDGTERETTYSSFVIDWQDRPHRVMLFRDMTGPRLAARTAAMLAQTAAQLVGSDTINEVLAGIARHAYEGTRALSAGIVVMGEDEKLAFGGGYGPAGPNFGTASPAWNALTEAPGSTVIAAMTLGAIVVGGAPGQAVFLPGARAQWEASPVMAGFATTMREDDWQGAICVPLAWENETIGLLGVYLPADMGAPNEVELAFCTALADQAAVAVANARLSVQAGRAAALAERSRLARELHDSVSQALFSMTMHARAAELAMVATAIDTGTSLSRSISQLAELARGTLAEMRALIFELRPEALAEEGLVGALRKQAAAIAAREQINVVVDGPPASLGLDADVEEHLYRIASEALHNVVKHARATTIVATVTSDDTAVRMTIGDDGIGFDQSLERRGHLGLSTMAQRAETIGAQLTMASRLGAGTVISLDLPIAREAI